MDPAGTVTAAAYALKKAGAKCVYVTCSHPVLSDPAIQRIQDAPIEELVTTNTIKLPETKKIAKIKQLTIAKIIGQGLLNIIEGKGVSSLFTYNPNNRM